MRFPLSRLIASFFCAMLAALSFSAKAKDPAPVNTPYFNFDDFTQGQPFKLNTLPTTKYGPAWADVSTGMENFLECEGGSYALCYYSGPQGTTPCEANGKGLAQCTCYQMPTGGKYRVLINAILNQEVYLQTVKACGHDGRKCKPRGKVTAPVCAAINDNKLIPGADSISTFSTALEKTMPIHPTSCPSGPYAGCMTAPCKSTGQTDPTTGLPLVQCACPTYNGPYQVGQKIEADQCKLPGYGVWSAAYNVPKKSGKKK